MKATKISNRIRAIKSSKEFQRIPVFPGGDQYETAFPEKVAKMKEIVKRMERLPK